MQRPSVFQSLVCCAGVDRETAAALEANGASGGFRTTTQVPAGSECGLGFSTQINILARVGAEADAIAAARAAPPEYIRGAAVWGASGTSPASAAAQRADRSAEVGVAEGFIEGA